MPRKKKTKLNYIYILVYLLERKRLDKRLGITTISLALSIVWFFSEKIFQNYTIPQYMTFNEIFLFDEKNIIK